MTDANTVQLGGTALGLALLWVANQRRPRSQQQAVATRRPGWIARQRAGRGVRHPRGRVRVGYLSATTALDLTDQQIGGNGLVAGATQSGKTNALRLLVEATAGRMPVVIIDAKGSPELEATVRKAGGIVWTLDGQTPADLLDPRPPLVAEQLLEDETYTGEAVAYGDAARERALWAAWALALRHEPMDVARLRQLLDRDALLEALRPFGHDPRVADWCRRLDNEGRLEQGGAGDLYRKLGNLLDGVALGGSLGTGSEAIRLEDVVDTRGLVLFKLSERLYPHATRKVAAWVLLAMARMADRLPAPVKGVPTALLLVDEVGALHAAARHLRGLVGRAREAGLAVVLATQGPSDLEAVDEAFLRQVLQNTTWQLVFRQGTLDSATSSRMLGVRADVEQSWRTDGHASFRQVEAWGTAGSGIGERVNVPPSALETLDQGDAWLRVAPVGKQHLRIARVRVARAHEARLAVPEPPTRTIARTTSRSHVSEMGFGPNPGNDDAPPGAPVRPLGPPPKGLPPVPPDCPRDLVAKMGDDILEHVDRRWPVHHHDLGPCFVWTGITHKNEGRYGWKWDPALGEMDMAHRIVWRRVYGPIPLGPNGRTLEVDELCGITLCVRPDHLRLLPKRENVADRGPTRGPEKASSNVTEARFTIALFESVYRTTPEQREVNLDELAMLLAEFQILEDKKHGRCWSPVKYRGEATRGNGAVVSVSTLVFDLDRVPPDPERLANHHWLAHTTYSHATDAPRWRLVLPLLRPVTARQWPETWRRARAALCPEADPACKDPSRAYWLPARRQGADHAATEHPGQLLDPRTLPALPPEPKRPELRKSPSARTVRDVDDTDRRRGEQYLARVLRNLAATPAGRRNAALNAAAWSLGRWIAAGAIDQVAAEDGLYAAAEQNGLITEDGQRQCWATIRSGLGAGLGEPIDLDAGRRKQ